MDPQFAPALPTFAATYDALKAQRRTCSLRISDGVLRGEVLLERGELKRAVFGCLEGETAIEALVAAGEVITFEITYDERELTTMLPPPPVEESMVVPISQFEEPAYEEIADDASTAAPSQHEAIVLETAGASTRASEPPALKVSEDIVEPRPSEFPAKRGDARVRLLVGSLLGLALLVGIYMGREAEQQAAKEAAPASAPVASAALAPAAAPQTEKTPEAPPPPAASAPAAPSAPAALRVLNPDVAPEAPSGALAPTILVRVLVGTDGLVHQAELAERRDGLAAAEQQALEAARNYRFQAGEPTERWLTLPVRFRPTTPAQRVVIKGSDILGERLLPAWAEAMRSTPPPLKLEIDMLGSTTGLASLLDGSADLAASARLVRADELALAEKLSLQLREVFVGHDGIAVIVHPSNPAQQLDLDTLARIFAQRVTNWKELGLPEGAIHVVGRPGYSGTHRVFKERVLSRLGPDVGYGARVDTVEKSADTIAAVARDPRAIGYVSFGFVKDEVRSLALASVPTASPVAPTLETIRDGRYSLTRPLLLYLRPDSGEGAHAIADFALTEEAQAIVEQQGFARITPGLVSGVRVGPPQPTAAQIEVVRIYFDAGSADIARTSLPDLTAAANAVRPGRSVVIIGNADSSGDAEANRAIAQRRADVVAARLRELGSREAVVTVQVASADHPIATNETSDGRRANRRVDVIVQRAPGRGL